MSESFVAGQTYNMVLSGANTDLSGMSVPQGATVNVTMTGGNLTTDASQFTSKILGDVYIIGTGQTGTLLVTNYDISSMTLPSNIHIGSGIYTELYAGDSATGTPALSGNWPTLSQPQQ
jgi:hypothetical protein